MMKFESICPWIGISPKGNPPQIYIIELNVSGLVKLPHAKNPSKSDYHRFEMYLHSDYPRLPPRLTWLTDIFHPNILPPDRNGGVCIGGWTAAESLPHLCIRIADMVQYKSYNMNDALDLEAAKWAGRNTSKFPVGNKTLKSD